MRLEPLYDKVLVKRSPESEKTKSGLLWIPPEAQEKNILCTVVSVGAGRVFSTGVTVPLTVVPGDSVLVAKYAGAEYNIEGETLLLITEADIVGKVHDNG